MSRVKELLPSRSQGSQNQPPDPRVVDIADEDAEEVFQALSSETARQLVAILRDEPCAPPDLADELDTSIQNVHYHLKKLTEADLVEPVDTWYSEKGVEMKVYAPADNPLVISSADDEQRSILRTALSRLLGAIAVLAGASVAVQWWVTKQLTQESDSFRELPTQPSPSPGDAAPLVPPGLLVFTGGLIVLVLVSSWWYYRTRSYSI